MKQLFASGFILGAAALVMSTSSAQQKAVEKSGQHSEIRLEHLVAGHLQELNGKYKLRVTEVTYDPSGFIGSHHHVGPGIRCVTSGQLSYEQPEKTAVYKQGDCFFESGDVAHTAHNLTKKPVILLNFELLPTSWSEGSAIPVPITP